MKTLTGLLLVLFMLPSFSFAQAAKVCDAQLTMAKVYSAFHRYVCLGLFLEGSGKTNTDQKDRAVNCAFGGVLGGLSIATIGSTANLAYSELSPEARKSNKKIKELNALQEKNKISIGQASSDWDAVNRFSRDVDLVRWKESLNNLKSAFSKFNITHAEIMSNYDKLSALNAKGNSFFKFSLKAAGATAGLEFLGVGAAILDAKPAGCGEIRHAYVDTDSACRYKPELGPNTSRFLNLPLEEQQKLMKDIPQLCTDYTVLAEKLESDLNKINPDPEFKVTSCDASGAVKGVDIKYPTGNFSIIKDADILKVNTGTTERSNYELMLKSGYGVDSVASVRTRMKTSNVSRVHIPSEVLKNPAPNNSLAHRELSTGLRALQGFNLIKEAIGNQCTDYLSSTPQTTDENTSVNQ